MNMKKFIVIALGICAIGASTAAAQTRTNSGWTAGHNWSGHHRPRTTIFIGSGFGYPYGYGYGYGFGSPYGYYPYGYGFYGTPRPSVYEGTPVAGDGSIVVAVQRNLARAGYYHNAIDGVMGNGTRRAIRAYERAHGLPVDGQIDRTLLATMGLA